MKVASKTLMLTIIALMIFTLIPIYSFAYAGEVSGNDEICDEFVEPTEDEYVICDDSPMEAGGDIDLLAISYFSVAFKRLSSTSAQATVSANSTVKSITSTVYLQRYVSSKGAYANVSGALSKKKVSAYSINHSPKFSISSGEKYRVKVVVTDGTMTYTKYTNL